MRDKFFVTILRKQDAMTFSCLEKRKTESCLGLLVLPEQLLGFFGQATKGVRWMPWHRKAMKDVVSCDKRRRGANNLRPGDVRMGKPSRGHARLPAREPTRGTETSKYPAEEKSTEIPPVAASERGIA